MAEKDPVLASKKRSRFLPLLLVIAVAVILVLSYTSLTYYQQARERDEGYKGQYALAQMMELSITNMIGSIDLMLNDSFNLTQRFQSAQIATSNFGELSMECEVMKNMYSSTSEECLTFGELEHASSTTCVAVNQMLMKMWENITNDEPYVHNVSRATAISDARDTFYTIMYCIGQGFDPSRDVDKDPYPVVDGMDLDGIRANAELIVEIVPIEPY